MAALRMGFPLAVIVGALAGTALGGVGAQDLVFGGGGIALAGASNKNETWNDVRVQPDGKIIVAGSNGGFYVARYLATGAPDTSFNGTGFVQLALSPAKTIAIQPDGKILVGGDNSITAITAAGNLVTEPAGAETDVEIVRLNANGSLDTTFGTGGIVRTDLSGGLVDSVSRIVLLPSGKFVAVGATGSTRGVTLTNWSIIGYNANGSLNTSFGHGGRVVLSFNQAAGSATALDAILEPGATSGASSASPRDIVAADFATVAPQSDLAARVQSDQVNAASAASAIAQAGKVVLVGTSGPNFAAARIDAATGALDASFGTGGVTTIAFPFASLAARATSVAAQADGKFLLVGDGTFFDSDAGDVSAQLLAGTRLSASGQIDPTLTAFPNSIYYAPDSNVVLSAGKPIVSVGGIRLIRLNSNGSVDSAFGDAGIFTPSAIGAGLLPNLATQADGKVLMAGTFFSNLQADSILIRIDPGASTTGTLLPPTPASNLAAPTVTAGSVRLTWQDNSNNETSFVVQRSLSSNFSNLVQVAGLAPNTTTFTDTTVLARTTYFYRIAAVNPAGTSLSGVVGVTTPRR